jgi:transcriptional regulator with XRE-family HTH domain
METLGQRIKRIRIEKGLTQKGLAEVSGLTGGQISYYEQDLRTPLIDNFFYLAEALGVSMDELYKGAE